MSETTPEIVPACGSIGELAANGRVIAAIACTKAEGHDGEHGTTLEWENDGYREPYDPDEVFDLEVPALEHDEAEAVIAAALDDFATLPPGLCGQIDNELTLEPKTSVGQCVYIDGHVGKHSWAK